MEKEKTKKSKQMVAEQKGAGKQDKLVIEGRVEVWQVSALWPLNLYNEILGLHLSMENCNEKYKKFFVNNQDAISVLDKIAQNLSEGERIVMYEHYKFGKTLLQIADDHNFSEEEVVALKRSMRKELVRPQNSKEYRKFFAVVDDFYEDENK